MSCWLRNPAQADDIGRLPERWGWLYNLWLVALKALRLDGEGESEIFETDKKERKRGSNAGKKTLSLDQFLLLLNKLRAHLKPVVATAFYTGMRREEIPGLTWDRVDLEGREIPLEAEHTKDAEDRTVPILEPLYQILKLIPKEHEKYIFVYRGERLHDIRTGLKKGCAEAGIPYGRKSGGITLHDLRHTFNTYMRKAGVEPHVIMEITGHSTDEMFRRYDTIDREDKQQAARQLENFLNNANVCQNVYSHPKQVSTDDQPIQ